jgi:hypothetical protein
MRTSQGRSDGRQLRKALLSDSFVLCQREQRSGLREIERQITGALLKASRIERTGFAQTETGKSQPVHLYLDNDFAEMATRLQIFERRCDILHRERLVDYGSDSEVFDHAGHPLEHFDGPDDHPLNAQSFG